MGVLWKPIEFIIIGGSVIGAFVIANPGHVIKKGMAAYGSLIKGPKYKKADYLELLTMQYQVFRMAKTKGMLALEQHVENPHDSAVFQAFPTFHHDHHAVEFMCDYLRLMTLGTDNPNEVETLIDIELDVHHHEADHVAHALNTMAESFPGLGTVAAVLGVIVTMGSISEPPEILGGLIASVIERLPNKLKISGHTDSEPFRSTTGKTNWELSLERANAGRRELEENGISSKRFVRATGFADRVPLLEDDPASPRNRRLIIMLQREDKDRTDLPPAPPRIFRNE